jgi:hypothetical protein
VIPSATSRNTASGASANASFFGSGRWRRVTAAR